LEDNVEDKIKIKINVQDRTKVVSWVKFKDNVRDRPREEYSEARSKVNALVRTRDRDKIKVQVGVKDKIKVQVEVKDKIKVQVEVRIKVLVKDRIKVQVKRKEDSESHEMVHVVVEMAILVLDRSSEIAVVRMDVWPFTPTLFRGIS
jgi:hypothetical protein